MSDHDSDPGSPAGDSLDDALREAFDGESVVEAISRGLGARPQVLLRDADDGTSPVVDPRSTVELDDPRYRTLGEIARGGVGIIFKGLDSDLGREVAIKVLQTRHAGHENIAERFLEEAQIGGQLQHPGIVPVYGLSTDRAGQPFFAMKLVRGKTLGALLAERSNPLEHRRRMLDIFLRLCRTVAYAHARGVIHRDLKPANVMIGGYGEAQLMDWGFAKVLDREPEERLPGATIVTTLRSDGEGSQSIAGSVMGTPAYMPPEQAMGQIDALDERCDVFALGAILCEVLTGSPPYVGEPTDLLLMAAQARLDDARERLGKCGADDELVALANECLAPVRGERPEDALRVAQRLDDHLAAVEERSRQHELDEAEARSRQREEQARLAEVTLAQTRAEQAAAERKRDAERVRARAAQEKRRASAAQQARQTTLVAAGLLLAALLLGGGGYIWHAAGARREARQRTDDAQAVFAQAAGLAKQGAFGRGASAAREAIRLLDGDDRARATALLATCEAEIAQRADLERRTQRYRALMRDLHQAMWSGEADAEIERVMREAKIAFDGKNVAAVVADVPSDLRLEFAGCMDFWLAARVSDWRLRDRNRDAIAAFSSALDPDPSRSELRTAVASGARPRVVAMARSWPAATAPPETTALLVNGLNTGFGNAEIARKLLEAARVHDSNSPILLSVGANVYLDLDPPDFHAAMSLIRRLVALVRDQAGGWGRLSYVAGSIGDVAAAEAAAAVCQELAPKSPTPLYRLYRAHRRIGSRRRAAEIAAELRRRFKTNVWGYLWASDLVYESGNAVKAFQWAKAARRVDADHPYPLLWLAKYSRAAGQYEKAVPLLLEFRKRNPDHIGGASTLAQTYLDLGRHDRAGEVMDRLMSSGTPTATVWAFQAGVLARRELWAEAATAARNSLELDEENVGARLVLARVHFAADEHPAAFRELGKANATRPFAATYFWAGLFHMERGEYARAHAAFGEAVRLRAPSAVVFAAHAAFLAGDYDVALRDTYAAADARRSDPLPHVVRGLIRARDGDFDQAEASLVKARELSKGLFLAGLGFAELELGRGRLSVAHEYLGRTLKIGPIPYYGMTVDFVGPGRRYYEWMHSATGPAANEELANAVRAYFAADYANAVKLFEKAGFESTPVWYLLATASAGMSDDEKGSAWAAKLVEYCEKALAGDDLRDRAEARWWLWRLRGDPRLPPPANDEGGSWTPIRAAIAKLLKIAEAPK